MVILDAPMIDPPALDRAEARGPHRADEFTSGDPCELSNGHRIECLPTGAKGSRSNLVGAAALRWDPDVTEAGTDTGYSPEPGTLRARWSRSSPERS